MAHDFRTLIQKADLALSELTTSGGVLQPAQAAKFVEKILRRAVLMPMCDVVTMAAPKQLIERMGFTQRVMRAGTARTALSSAERAKPVLEKVELDAKYLKAEVRIDNQILEDSIERGNLKATIMTQLLKAIPRDLDELLAQGDVTSADSYLAVLDGFIKKASSHVYDANDAELTDGVFKLVLRNLPLQYRGDKRNMVFLTGHNAELEFRNAFGQRNGLDSYLLEDKRIAYQGVPVVPVDMWPEQLGDNEDQTTLLLTNRANMKFGIWRQMSIKTDEDITSDEVIVVVTMRLDATYQEEDAVAKGVEVRVPAAA